MKLQDKAQIGVLFGRNVLNPFSMYVTEILETEGFCYQLIEAVNDGFDLVVIPDISLTEAQSRGIRDLADAGGNILCLHPTCDLLPLFGLETEGTPYAWAGRYLRMLGGIVLQYHGPASLVNLAGAEVCASLQCDFDAAPSEFPAVSRYENGGRRAAFTFDLAASVVLSHQGRSDQASDGPNPNPDGNGCFRMNNLFVNHLDPRCKMIPQADVLQDLFVEMIYWATEKASPIPRIWHFPHEQPAVAFMTGDSDQVSRADIDLVFDTSEAFGAKYTLYLMSDNFDALPPADLCELRRKGHDVGAHPWHSPAPCIDEFEACLRNAHSAFSSRYGYLPATVRNHYVVSPGWVSTPDILRRIGLRMDLNAYPARGFQCGYLTGSGLPVKLMDSCGEVMDIYRQCTLYADDVMVTDKCNLPAKSIDQAIETGVQMLSDVHQKYHGVYQACFHPIRLQSYEIPTIEWYKATLDAVRSRDMLSVSGQQWCDFNDARRTVEIARDGQSWRLSTRQPIGGLTVLWPERVKSVIADGTAQVLKKVNWGGVGASSFACDVKTDATVRLSVVL